MVVAVFTNRSPDMMMKTQATRVEAVELSYLKVGGRTPLVL